MRVRDQLCVLLLTSASAMAGAATGPVAHWRFDEAAGLTASDSAGNFGGTLAGTASFMPGGGVANGALSLTRSGHGRVVIGNVLPLVGQSRFTISAWVKLPVATAPEQLVLGRHTSNVSAGWFLAVNVSGGSYGAPGKAWFYASHGPGPEPVSTTSVNDNSWHQIVVTRDPSTIRMYVDGAPAESSKTPVGILANPAPLMIGAIIVGANPTGYVDGLLDDLQIYNRVLSDADIQALFNTPGSEVAARCLPDITHGAVAGADGYGRPNCVVDNDDFFYYLAQFSAGNMAVADMTTGAIAGQPGYGVPNGVINNEDFFYYLAIFAAGC